MARDAVRMIDMVILAVYAAGVLALAVMAAQLSVGTVSSLPLQVYVYSLAIEGVALAFIAPRMVQRRVAPILVIPSFMEALRWIAGGAVIVVDSLVASRVLGMDVAPYAILSGMAVLTAVTFTTSSILRRSRRLLAAALLATAVAEMTVITLSAYIMVYVLRFVVLHGSVSAMAVTVGTAAAATLGLFYPSHYHRLLRVAMDASHQ